MPDPIAHEMLDCVHRIAARRALPPVRALHLPPVFARGSKDGEFCALELADGSIGLSYVLLGDTLQALLASPRAAREPGRPALALAGVSVAELAEGYARADPVERTLGFAAVNAVSQCLFARAGYLPEPAADSIGAIDPRPGEQVGMVGLFPGLARRIVAAGARLVVVELDAALAGDRDGYRVTLDPGELAGCDKVLSTTTLLLNDTLDAVVAACSRARTLALVGPGGGCVPDPLFARGVTQLGGTGIVDRAGFLAALAAGQPWGGFTRKYVIERDRYPGLQALLQRAG